MSRENTLALCAGPFNAMEGELFCDVGYDVEFVAGSVEGYQRLPHGRDWLNSRQQA
jgi:hypothetical protein